MKKIYSFIFILLMLSNITILLASSNECPTKIQKLDRNLIPISGLDKGTIVLPYTEEVYSHSIDYQFVVEPTTIMTSYYDYMPGGFSNYPIQRQLDNGSGTYLTFHATETPTSTRSQYWAYYDEDGTLQDCDIISNSNEFQGFGDIVLHSATGDCIASWIENGYCTLCYDDYKLMNVPGNWSSVTTISISPPDEYLYPRLYTGPSPNGDDWIRIYHISQNVTPNSQGHACNDVIIMYMDIQNSISADLTQILNLNNWTTITPMYSWREKSCQVQSLCFAADDYYYNPGKVGMMGYCNWLEGDLGDMPVQPGLFFWESNDYGVTWDVANLHCHSQDSTTALYQVRNKPGFEFDGVVPDYLDVEIGGFNNTAYYYESHFVMSFLQYYTYTDPQTKETFYLEYFKPQAEVVWDYYEPGFNYNEIPEIGYDSYSGHSVPWRTTQNDTILYIVVTEPVEYGNSQKNAIGRWSEFIPRIQMWTDLTYHTMAQLGYSQYDEYLEHPIINIAFVYEMLVKYLPDYWYNLIEFTDIHNPLFDFSDQITVYPYIDCNFNYTGYSDDFWSGWDEVYLYYYDDNSFGSYILGNGDDTGGQLKYCVFLFRVAQYTADEEFTPSVYATSAPNPFSHSTQISYLSSEPIQTARVSIYNARGQLVNMLDSQEDEISSKGYAVWNGKDMNGNHVSSGIYFYKVDIDGTAQFNKILLTR